MFEVYLPIRVKLGHTSKCCAHASRQLSVYLGDKPLSGMKHLVGLMEWSVQINSLHFCCEMRNTPREAEQGELASPQTIKSTCGEDK